MKLPVWGKVYPHDWLFFAGIILMAYLILSGQSHNSGQSMVMIVDKLEPKNKHFVGVVVRP